MMTILVRLTAALGLFLLVTGHAAFAQDLDVTVSLNAVFGKEGFSPDSNIEVVLNTKLGEVAVRSSTVFTILPMGFASETLGVKTKLGDFDIDGATTFTLTGITRDVTTISTTVSDIRVKVQSVLDLQEPSGLSLTLSSKLDNWNLSSTTSFGLKPGTEGYFALYHVAFEGFSQQTFGASTATDQGLKLAGATTLGLQEGALKLTGKSLGVGFSLSGMNVMRTSKYGLAGLVSETLDMSAEVQGVALSRSTIYTGEGFASETLTLGGALSDYDLSHVMVWDKTGLATCALTVSRTFENLKLD